MILDLTSAYVYGGGYDGSTLVDVTSIAGIDWTHLSNIGFNIGATVPLGPNSNDWTFETIVTPVPEPTSMLLLGIGLLLLLILGAALIWLRTPAYTIIRQQDFEGVIFNKSRAADQLGVMLLNQHDDENVLDANGR